MLVESPSNPLLRVVDIAEIARQAHAVGALVLVDNTFMTPILQKPLELGADIVSHSGTKFLNGHSDLLAGILVFKDRSRNTVTLLLILATNATFNFLISWVMNTDSTLIDSFVLLENTNICKRIISCNNKIRHLAHGN